ncbi:MAG: hypothetical protein Q4C58_10890 [Eubacteriales bacterium]|nr:hypothetical protein [Eubacteriales bacterium]
MSFIDDLKRELLQGKTPEQESSCPSANQERFQEFLQEETAALQQKIREDARRGKYQRIGDKHIFKGVRPWHEGDYRHGTESLATFYSFLARDTILERVVLSQRKKLIGGYSYEVRYSLSREGSAYFETFTKELAREGIQISGLYVQEENGATQPLPYIDRGDVKYDFELEHHLIDYPKLCYSYLLEF